MRTSLRIDVLNPKVVKLLNDLADLNLISIEKDNKVGFKEVLKKLRLKSKRDSQSTLHRSSGTTITQASHETTAGQTTPAGH
jgi:hypothetical protein